MLIAAALIELELPDADSIKARRRVANAVKQRIRNRFEVSVAEVGDADARHEVVLGCVLVGVDPPAMRERMERVIRFVERLGLAEVVADDVTIARLDELPEVEEP
jgi:uncharacterized protein YlxP (DUF503 family)